MIRLPDAAEGFCNRAALVVSRLRTTVAASLAVGVLALCLIVTLIIISARAGAAAPL
jgi:hypothetical protein